MHLPKNTSEILLTSHVLQARISLITSSKPSKAATKDSMLVVSSNILDGSYKMYDWSSMSKTVNGDNEGVFTSLAVNPDDSIVQDLTVQGTLTAAGVAVSTLTGNYYTASDANYQYRFDSGTMDLKSTSSGAPTVRLLNNVNSSASTTLQTGVMTALTSNTTTQYTSQQNTSAGTAGGAGFKSINDSSNSVEITMRSSTHSTKPNHADILATGATSIHFGSNNSADISIRTNATERINVANTLITTKQPISQTDTTESSSKTVGSIVTSGGIGIAKSCCVGGAFVLDGNFTVGTPAAKDGLINFGRTGVGIFRSAYIYQTAAGNMSVVNQENGTLTLATNNADVLQITAAGQSNFLYGVDTVGTLAVGTAASKYFLINLGKSGGGTFRSAYINGDTSGNMVFANQDTTGYLAFNVGNAERVRILSDGKFGLGTTPSYLLHLNSDSAAKPSTNTWTISSDARLKENIELADLDVCYQNMKSIPLKRYTWKDDVYTEEQVHDRSKLGWIAQDVESVFPKAVEQKEMFGYEDCKTLNADQIYATMYGAIQKLIQKVEYLESQIV